MTTDEGVQEGVRLLEPGADGLLQMGTCFTGDIVKGRAYDLLRSARSAKALSNSLVKGNPHACLLFEHRMPVVTRVDIIT